MAAFNAVLERYLAEELSAAQSAALPMSEVHEGLKTLTADFTRAYEAAFARVETPR